MSLRIDINDLFTSSVVIGNTGLGVLAEDIPSTGDSGASFLYNDLNFPADNGKEIRGEITTFPSSGTFFAYEDGSFEFSGAADGRYDFTYQLKKDGVTSATYTVTLTVGNITGSGSGAIALISLSSVAGSGNGSGIVTQDGTGVGTLTQLQLAYPNAVAYTGVITLTQADVDWIVSTLLNHPKTLTVQKFLGLK